MKSKMFAAAFGLLMITAFSADAQNYRRDQLAQEAMIKKAYSRGRVTRNEYSKLMKEQQVIKETIWKAKRDRVITPVEQARIDSKLDRAADRLDRYKHNWER